MHAKSSIITRKELEALIPPVWVNRVAIFYSNHTRGLENQINAWMEKMDKKNTLWSLGEIQYRHIEGAEFSALIKYQVRIPPRMKAGGEQQ